MKVNMKPHTDQTMANAGWYILDYRDGGVKGKRKRQKVKGREEAERIKAELQGDPLTEDTITFPRLCDVVDEYLSWCRKNQAAATVVGKLRRFNAYIIPALGDKRVQDLSQRVLDAYGAKMTQIVYRRDVLNIKALVRWMIKRRYAEPLNWSPELPAHKAGIKNLPSAPEILRFIEALALEAHRIVCTLMLYTGLRWNEARNLQWENYRDDGTILLLVSKTDNAEIITIPEPCAEWFRAHKSPTGYIFSCSQGKTPMVTLQHPLALASAATGIYMRSHMFRHASATFLYEVTQDIYAVQHHLRHSRITTSEIYTRYSAARRKGSVEAIVGLMSEKSGQSGHTPKPRG